MAVFGLAVDPDVAMRQSGSHREPLADASMGNAAYGFMVIDLRKRHARRAGQDGCCTRSRQCRSKMLNELSIPPRSNPTLRRIDDSPTFARAARRMRFSCPRGLILGIEQSVHRSSVLRRIPPQAPYVPGFARRSSICTRR